MSYLCSYSQLYMSWQQAWRPLQVKEPINPITNTAFCSARLPARASELGARLERGGECWRSGRAPVSYL